MVQPPASGGLTSDVSLDRGRWDRLCERIGCPELRARFDELRAAYGERHRHYHTAQHISECLTVFDDVTEQVADPESVEFAIWLHDFVYRVRRNDNEEASAAVARAWLHDCGDAARAEEVTRLVKATKHDGRPGTGDEALLLDIDLNVLGARRARYDEYEAQVRREYRWVPGPLFRRRRAELLEAFLNRDSIYRTEWFRTRWEQTARDNLARAIRVLRDGGVSVGE